MTDDFDVVLEEVWIKNLGKVVPLVWEGFQGGHPIGYAEVVSDDEGLRIKGTFNSKRIEEMFKHPDNSHAYSYAIETNTKNLLEVHPIPPVIYRGDPFGKEGKMSDNKVEATFHDGAEPKDEVRTSGDVNAPQPDPGTHALALNVHVNNPEDFEKIWAFFGLNAEKLGRKLPYVSVESWLLNGDEPGVDEDSEYYDEETLVKVKDSIALVVDQAFSLIPKVFQLDPQQMIQDIVSEMQNNGILFRERRP